MSGNSMAIEALSLDMLKQVCQKHKIKSTGKKAEVLKRVLQHAEENKFRKNDYGEYTVNITSYKNNDEKNEEEQTTQAEQPDPLSMVKSVLDLTKLDSPDSNETDDEEIEGTPKTIGRTCLERLKKASKQVLLSNQIRKEAMDIKEVKERKPKLFQDLLKKIDRFSENYDWSDETKNALLTWKIEPDLLDETDFSRNFSWETNKKLIQDRFGLSYHQLSRKLELFSKMQGERPTAAFIRLRKILLNPVYNFNNQEEKSKKETTLRFMKKVFGSRDFPEFNRNWRTDGYPLDLTKIQDLVEETEEMLPQYDKSEFDEENDSDEYECFAMHSERMCYKCGKAGHLARYCTAGKDDENIDRKIDNMAKKIKEEIRVEFKEEIKTKMDEQHDCIKGQLNLILQNQQQPRNNYSNNAPNGGYRHNNYGHRGNRQYHGGHQNFNGGNRYQNTRREPIYPCRNCNQTKRPYHWRDECPVNRGQR